MHACASLHACCTVRGTDGTLNRESMRNACLCIFACMLHRPGHRRDVKPGVDEQCMLVHLCMHAAPSGGPTGR